ncbi:MAG: type II secretion system protein GspD [bacterium]
MFIRMKHFWFVLWGACFPVSILLGATGDRSEARGLLLKDVRESWRMPVWQESSKTEERTEIVEAVKPTLQQRIKHIILPKFVMNNLPLAQTLKVLTEVVRVYDLESKDGINFVLVDPQHKAPNVDLDLQSVSLEKVIHFIKEQTNLEVSFVENTIVFKDSSQGTGKLETQVFPISRGNVLQALTYSRDSKDERSDEQLLKEFFQKLGIPFSDEKFGFVYDGQNIIVTHYPQYLCKIDEIVALYRQDKQIAIEAKFLEVKQGVLEELGLKWNSGSNNNVAVNTSGLRSLSGLQTEQNDNHAPKFPNTLDFGTKISDFLNANVFLNRYQMSALVRAIEQRTDTDLMSAPKVMVLSGRKAEIVVAQELRYPERYRDGQVAVGQAGGLNASSAGTGITSGVPENFVTRNIGVEMSVTPVAEKNNKIHLCLEPSVTEFEGFVEYGGKNIVTVGGKAEEASPGYYQPIFSTRKIKTEVSLNSGSTLVMGGLTREEVKETHDKIPVLSNIPLLGNLFKSKGQTSQKKNLLIFVTANLVDENGKCITNPEIPTVQKL